MPVPEAAFAKPKIKRVSPGLREENAKEINTDAQFWKRSNAVVVEHKAVVWHVVQPRRLAATATE